MNNYFKEMKANRRVMHLGTTGLEILFDPDGTAHHAKLRPEERKELKIRIRIENLLAKAVDNGDSFRELLNVPYTTIPGVPVPLSEDPIGIYEHILNEKMKPFEARDYLLELKRYYWITWRG